MQQFSVQHSGLQFFKHSMIFKMFGRRWMIRLSVVLNICVVFYVAVYSTTSTFPKTRTTPSQERLKLVPCDDLTPRTRIGKRGQFYVLYNYFKPTRRFSCDESITYATHADFTFLDNLIPLLTRWQGQISLSIYAPGTDFDESLKRIEFLRECLPSSGMVKELVNFHIFFDDKSVPKVTPPVDPSTRLVNCSAFTSVDTGFGQHLGTYRKTKELRYPVNVARNVALEMATTHYVMTADIELYPNPSIIPDFMAMLERNSSQMRTTNPKVFVLPIFEVEGTVTALPHDKTELVLMLRNKTAVVFRSRIVAHYHRIPKSEEWIESSVKGGLNVFHVAQRYKPYEYWEPIFIGTKFEPMYDERLTWEGQSDKMTQAYGLCLLGYEFHILDNAFLVHRPGIKKAKKKIDNKTPGVVSWQNTVIKYMQPELKQLYGSRNGCRLLSGFEK